MSNRVFLHECYFETRRYGNYLRVSCLDPHTGIEAYTTGPMKMGEEMLKRSAKRKLEYILTRRKNTEQKKRPGWFI